MAYYGDQLTANLIFISHILKDIVIQLGVSILFHYRVDVPLYTKQINKQTIVIERF